MDATLAMDKTARTLLEAALTGRLSERQAERFASPGNWPILLWQNSGCWRSHSGSLS